MLYNKNKNNNTFIETGSRYLHQSHRLLVLYTFPVYENQSANDGTNETEASNQAGDDERGVEGQWHRLGAAGAVVVPVFTHRTSEETHM